MTNTDQEIKEKNKKVQKYISAVVSHLEPKFNGSEERNRYH